MDLDKKALVYTSHYCEENIYQLCKTVQEKNSALLKDLTVIFISNEQRSIPLWKQNMCRNEWPVIWDYHVILHCRTSVTSVIYDFDTVLQFPCSALDYIKESLRPEYTLKEEFKRWFRCVPAIEYLCGFASDRSHMLKEGVYCAPPPNYMPICTAEHTMNLEAYISMRHTSLPMYGIVQSEEAIMEWL
ncbi:N-terminal glutamine amidase-domain-containing protein [Spinellus fusiger]|nr:N-terminal glutamine amidase-domain-containing protein [Spinellus fusiger]